VHFAQNIAPNFCLFRYAKESLRESVDFHFSMESLVSKH
jgi:hypothetical protein